MEFTKNIIYKLKLLKKYKKYDLWKTKGSYIGFTYKNNTSHYISKYTDMFNNNIYIDEKTNNYEYLKHIYKESLICNLVPVFDLKKKVYLKIKE